MKAGAGQQTNDQGFTLIELLVAIVVVGILTAVAIVGVAGLQDRGAQSACMTSMDAANSATLAFYSNSGGDYPQTFTELTNPASGPPLLTLAPGVIPAATTLTGKGGWTLTLHPGASLSDKTTFDGC